MPQNGLHRVRSEFAEGLAVFLRKTLQHRLHQERQILLARAQGRQGDRHHTESEKQVLAKFALGNHLRKVPVGRGHEAHIHLDRRVSAHPFEAAFLAQNAQKLHLRGVIDLADFIQKHCATVGLFEPANAPLRGACERTLLVPEQFALEQLG